MRNELELVGLGYGSYKQYVDQQTMQAIKALLYHNTYCRYCYGKFTDANPEVNENTCLACFAQRHEQFTYTYIWTEDRQGDRTYRFLDARGHIHLTSAHSSHVTENIGDIKYIEEKTHEKGTGHETFITIKELPLKPGSHTKELNIDSISPTKECTKQRRITTSYTPCSLPYD